MSAEAEVQAATDRSASRRGVFFGWRVVGAAFVVAVFAWGTGFYGPSVFLHALHEERGWPVSTISAAITCHFLLSAAIGSRLPAIHGRFGLSATTRAAAVATALGALAWARAREPWHLFPAALVSGAGRAGTSAAAISAMVAPWFERRRAAALAIAFNGASIGGVLFAPLWALLIAGWGFAAAATAVGAAMVTAVWWLAGRYLAPTPGGMGLAPDGGEPAAAPPGAPASPRDAPPPLPTGAATWRNRRFATLAAAIALGLFAQIGLVAHLFSLLAPALGAAGAGAGAARSLTAACAVVGRTLLGALLPERADRRAAAAANFAVQVAGSLALRASGGSSAPLLLAGCVLFGLGVGNMVSLPPLIAQAEFARGVQHAPEQPLGGLVLEQAGAELAERAAVKAGIRQVEGEQVLPVDPATDGIGGMAVAQLLAELRERDEGQAPGRNAGWPGLG